MVFKDIREERFNIGSKFRFRPNYGTTTSQDSLTVSENLKCSDDLVLNQSGYSGSTYKNRWLVINREDIKITSSVVVQRCNGTLKSFYVDDDTKNKYIHEEPVILADALTSTSLFYNETLISPQSDLLVITQYNKYTAQYYMNQRFIVGNSNDSVYRVKAINKFYSNTESPNDVGLMRVYLQITDASQYDDFINRVAYDMDGAQPASAPVIPTTDETIIIDIIEPQPVPTGLYNTLPVTFKAQARSNSGTEYPDLPISVSLEIPGISSEQLNSVVSIEKDNNTFILTKKRTYTRGSLLVKCYIPSSESPSGEEIIREFTLSLGSV